MARSDRRETSLTQLPAVRPGPLGGKRDQNRRARTEALLAAAERLFLARGIGDVSIDDITREAGVAKGSFYRYFASKEAVVRTLLAPVRKQVVRAFQTAQKQLSCTHDETQLARTYLRLGRELLIVVLGRPTLTRLYLQESRAPAVHARVPVRELEAEIAQLALGVTEAAVARGLMHRTPPEVSTLALVGAAERLLSAYFDGSLKISPKQAVQGLVELALHGVRRGRSA